MNKGMTLGNPFPVLQLDVSELKSKFGDGLFI